MNVPRIGRPQGASSPALQEVQDKLYCPPTITKIQVLFILIFLFFSCKETLPPYLSPERVLVGDVGGLYVLTASDNSVKLYFTVRNVFDETLQGPAKLAGKIQIVLGRNPQVRKTAVLGVSNILYARSYDRQTGVITLDPGDSIRLGYSWDLVDDNGIDLRTSFFSYVSDPTCPDSLPETRRITLEEKFQISGELLVFDRTGQVVPAPKELAFCYATNWVNPKYCPPIIPGEPCRSGR